MSETILGPRSNKRHVFKKVSVTESGGRYPGPFIGGSGWEFISPTENAENDALAQAVRLNQLVDKWRKRAEQMRATVMRQRREITVLTNNNIALDGKIDQLSRQVAALRRQLDTTKRKA